MKKIVSFLLCLMMILSMISCGSNEERDGSSQNPPTQDSDAEMAMQLYEAAIKGDICVTDERAGETSLKSLCFTSNGLSLEECRLLKKAIADIDGDGANEFIIQSPDNEYIILRYHNSKVYSYRFDINDFYDFNTDGTFYWYDHSETSAWECGLNKIVFDGETLTAKSIYNIKYSTNPTKYEYFIEGESVSENEYYHCRSDNTHNKKIKFSYFDMACSYPITAEQAWNLANAYWDNQDGYRDYGAGTTFVTGIVLTDAPNSDAEYYRAVLQVEWYSGGGQDGYECMPPKNIQLKEQILVNAFTGEITTLES